MKNTMQTAERERRSNAGKIRADIKRIAGRYSFVTVKTKNDEVAIHYSLWTHGPSSERDATRLVAELAHKLEKEFGYKFEMQPYCVNGPNRKAVLIRMATER